MSGKHSQPIRGLFHPAAPEALARFGRMFPDLPPAKYGSDPEASLTKLAKAMVSGFDPPKDGPDGEESGIPSLYTYFGQFVDHDLTFGPEGSFQKQKDIDATEDFRTPAFDLDNIYGRGPNDQPYLYDEDGKTLLLGDPLTQGSHKARDLQRNANGRALIGDPRNDENAIVSQLQGLFLQFHNRVVEENPHFTFEQCQEYVRAHYQHIVLYDFLPRFVHESVLNELKTEGIYDAGKLRFFTGFSTPYMPIEFSVAAYRMGHSMVRPGYQLNDSVLLPIFPIPAKVKPGFPEGLVGFRRMISDWGLDWGRFIDIDIRNYGTDPASTTPLTDAQKFDNFRRLQFAYRIDTALVDPLGSLPIVVAGNQPLSLALRNLLRGNQLGLPSGQAVAEAMRVRVLHNEEILIGQGVDTPDKPLLNILQATGDDVFSNNCPLWAYILAEAMRYKVHVDLPAHGAPKVATPQLGPVGGRIVAEVFLGLYLDEKRKIEREVEKGKIAPMTNFTPPTGYKLKDFVKYALRI